IIYILLWTVYIIYLNGSILNYYPGSLLNYHIQLFKKLNSKLRGYYNYYGLIGNYDSLEEFFNISLKILYKWLNRRSQRKSMNWDKFEEIIGWYNACKPRIVEKTNRQLRFNFA
ncbi:group II intron maturase-specific domain-containing protein, partial [Halanaerobium salsuginis]